MGDLGVCYRERLQNGGTGSSWLKQGNVSLFAEQENETPETWLLSRFYCILFLQQGESNHSFALLFSQFYSLVFWNTTVKSRKYNCFPFGEFFFFSFFHLATAFSCVFNGTKINMTVFI